MASTQGKREQKPRLKIVVRGLPAQLAEQAFQSTIEKYLDSIDFWYYAPGRVTEKKNVNSRAYLNFKSTEALQDFWRAFDGHIFIISKGKEQKARIEFAPFQKVPNKTKKRGPDPRENTLFEDPEYLKFVETLNEPIKLLPSAEEQLDKRLAEEKEREANGTTFLTTPLLEYLKLKRAQKSKRGDRSDRRKRAKDRNPKDTAKKTDEKKENKGPRRSKDKEERRKKPKGQETGEKKPAETVPTPQITILKDKPKDINAKSEEEKLRKNGSYQIRKSQEPGLIAIQPREQNPDQQPVVIQQRGQRKPQGSNAGNTGQAAVVPNNAAAPRKSNTPRRGGRGATEVKVYAPKIQQAPAVAAQNGP